MKLNIEHPTSNIEHRLKKRMSLHHSTFDIRYSLFIFLFALSGCLVGGRYTAPPRSGIDSLYRYPNQTSNDSITLLKWTDIYRDPTLQQLIKTTLDSN